MENLINLLKKIFKKITRLGATKPVLKAKCVHIWRVKGESNYLYQTSGQPMTTYYCEKCLTQTDQ